MTATILATGGAGYIGSHVVLDLIRSGYRVVILDNFENSDPSVVERLQRLTGTEINVFQHDVADTVSVARILDYYKVDAVIHLAGKKSVGESVAQPLMYHDANLGGAIGLMLAMKLTGVNRLVFSSSATVYGVPERLPIDERAATGTTNPYGRTKLICEEIISDYADAAPDFGAISLRYFNPVGADASGLIGENPVGVPNNLFPYVAQTAAGIREEVQVYGDDYDTHDGSGLRDYIHVSDLARGHVAALAYLLSDRPEALGHLKVNLGTGSGHTVLDVIRAFSKACGAPVPYRIVGRRAGDVAASVADPALAERLFGWKATKGLDRMCRDHWRFQKGSGFGDANMEALRTMLNGAPRQGQAARI